MIVALEFKLNRKGHIPLGGFRKFSEVDYAREPSEKKQGFPYRDFIWQLAAKFTNSTEEAEAAAREIFDDIQKYNLSRITAESIENQLESQIALRRLCRYLY